MIQSVLTTLFQVIVPLSIPVIVGALLAKYKNLETKPLLTLYLYYLSPAIIYQTLTTAEISFSEVYTTFGVSIVNLIMLWAVANLIGRLLKLSASETAGLTLVSTFTNSVNYGLPLVLLAFGKLGLDKASVYVIAQMIIVNTIGIYFAARSQFSIKQAIRSVFSLPAIYAAIAAVIVRSLDIHFPAGVQKGIAMIAEAYSPVVLAILGAQMASVKKTVFDPGVQKAFWAGMTVRLILSPLIACLVLTMLHVQGMLFSVLLILASMPAAVNAGILAERFQAAPQVVTKCILWTTLASFIVLPLLIVIVK
ncbi:AEC family transporter [Paenibacillus doosanensis]|uniref:Membrane transport protein n=1 Tax=Paenibacillus konkukensis TaxID=2020716 RepID=A0ABY4S350_9BACL|nr:MULTISPECIES: AEC family transporter [Paenibacillus]MCS7463332.1 AEC family transporter [Paenibacillus doosanensis]UQZ87637.1 Membrane transport protein [Paenibacillus konkukensis]